MPNRALILYTLAQISLFNMLKKNSQRSALIYILSSIFSQNGSDYFFNFIYYILYSKQKKYLSTTGGGYL